jgi:hypothetical protein
LHPVAARAALFDFYACSIAASLFAKERNTMLNAEPNTALEILSENGARPTSIGPALPSSHHSSPHRPGRLTRSTSGDGASSAKGPDPWATTLAAIHQFSALSDPMRNSPDLSSRAAPARKPGRPRETNGDDVRTFTVTVVEELPKARFALRWHDPTLCNYEEQVWSPCPALGAGRCALSGRHIKRGDKVYRPRDRGRLMPLNGDAMILARELIKAHIALARADVDSKSL